MVRILIVDDHRLFAEALEFLLGQRLSENGAGPAEVRLAPTAAEGVALADGEGPFDLAVVDLLLPDGDGGEVMRQIKDRYPETRVVVLTAVADPSGALSVGADVAISKGRPLLEIVSQLAAVAKGREPAGS